MVMKRVYGSLAYNTGILRSPNAPKQITSLIYTGVRIGNEAYSYSVVKIEMLLR